MKRVAVLFLFLMVTVYSLPGQNKLLVYTSVDSAWFIPYINGDRYLMAPTDSFEVVLDTNRVEIFIHFPDSSVSDIYKRISFEHDSVRKFRIVIKPKLLRQVNHLGLKVTKPAEYARTHQLHDYYMLKDESFQLVIGRKKKK